MCQAHPRPLLHPQASTDRTSIPTPAAPQQERALIRPIRPPYPLTPCKGSVGLRTPGIGVPTLSSQHHRA
jgi:hypothetical protein